MTNAQFFNNLINKEVNIDLPPVFNSHSAGIVKELIDKEDLISIIEEECDIEWSKESTEESESDIENEVLDEIEYTLRSSLDIWLN